MKNSPFPISVRKFAKTIILLAILVCCLFKSNSYASTGKITETSISRECNKYFKILEYKYHMPKNLMKAIAYTESGKWSRHFRKNIVWPWTINSHGKGYYFKTKQEAIDKVKELKKMGRKSIDVGCMQINLKYHPDAFKNLDEALSPKHNIGYSAQFIANKYKRYNSWETAIRHYHNRKRKYSNRYLRRVLKIWDKANMEDDDKPSLVSSVNNQYPVIYMNKKREKEENPYNMYIVDKDQILALLD